MTIENQNLRRLVGSIDLVGRVAITTQKTHALKSPDLWTGRETIPAGTVALIIEQVDNKFVKIIWDEQTTFVTTDTLRLIKINNDFGGKSFAITGDLSVSRDYFKNLIKLKGGKFKSHISKYCDYLIVGSPTHSEKSTKLKKAMKLGVDIITEQQFFDLIGGK